MKIRVYYEDTDLGGIVYHSNYLNFCERARSELFFSKGYSPVLKEGHFVAKHLDASFVKPAKFADILNIKTTLTELKNASFTLLQEVYRDDKLCFKMNIDLVYLNHENRVSRLSKEQKEFLRAIIQ